MFCFKKDLKQDHIISLTHSFLVLEIMANIKDVSSEEIICAQFLERLMFHFELEKSAIYLKDIANTEDEKKNHIFYFIYGSGISDKITIDRKIDAFEEGISVLYNLKVSIKIDENSKHEFKNLKILQDLKNALIIPLIYQEEVIGFLIAGRTTNKKFTELEHNLIYTLFNKIGTIINQKSLYRELQISKAKLTEAYENLKSLDKLKTSFLHNITHEFRTPLAKIIGYIELIKSGDLGEINFLQKKYLNTVYNSAIHLESLIDNLLTFVKLSDKFNKNILEKIEFISFVSNIIKNFQETNVPILFSTEISKVYIKGDHFLLRNVIEQFLSNAIKFNKENNPITVEIYKKNDKILVFKVIDQGIGIPKSKLNKIIDSFYQLDYTMDRKYEGLGFGLTIAYKIIQLHGFKFIIDSTPGRGTEVGFEASIEES